MLKVRYYIQNSLSSATLIQSMQEELTQNFVILCRCLINITVATSVPQIWELFFNVLVKTSQKRKVSILLPIPFCAVWLLQLGWINLSFNFHPHLKYCICYAFVIKCSLTTNKIHLSGKCRYVLFHITDSPLCFGSNRAVIREITILKNVKAFTSLEPQHAENYDINKR